jgi:hypothetical protein
MGPGWFVADFDTVNLAGIREFLNVSAQVPRP